MDSNDYYRNLHQPPAYGRKIMRELFESGNAQDGLPGIQQTTENLVRDMDGIHFAIVKAPTFTRTTSNNYSYTSGYYFLDDSFHVLPTSSVDVTITKGDYVFLTTGGVITGSSALNMHGMLLGIAQDDTGFTGVQNGRKVSGTDWVDQHTEKQVFINTIYSANQTGTYSYTVSGYTDKAVVNDITGSTFYLFSGYIVSGHFDFLDNNINGNDKNITNLVNFQSDYITGTQITGEKILGVSGYFNKLSGLTAYAATLYFSTITGSYITGTYITGQTIDVYNLYVATGYIRKLGADISGNGFNLTGFDRMSGSRGYFDTVVASSTIYGNTVTGGQITGTNISGGTIIATTYTGASTSAKINTATGIFTQLTGTNVKFGPTEITGTLVCNTIIPTGGFQYSGEFTADLDMTPTSYPTLYMIKTWCGTADKLCSCAGNVSGASYNYEVFHDVAHGSTTQTMTSTVLVPKNDTLKLDIIRDVSSPAGSVQVYYVPLKIM